MEYKFQYNFKDGSIYTLDPHFSSDENVFSEFFKLMARGRNQNSKLYLLYDCI